MITDEQFIQAMHDVVKGREDYVYEFPDGPFSCVYVDSENNPSCLIGHALIKCGVGIEFFTDTYNLESAASLLPKFKLSKKVVRAAEEAQEAQDNAETWGDALEVFDRELQSNP